MNINLTLIGQTLAFMLFVWFCLKYIWPYVIGALEQRKQIIADGLAAAERGVREQQLAEERAKDRLHEAKQEAGEIIHQAQRRANEIIESAKANAQQEAERIKDAAEAEIEQEVNRAKEHLRLQVSKIAIAGAEKVLQKEIDASTHKKALDELITQI